MVSPMSTSPFRAALRAAREPETPAFYTVSQAARLLGTAEMTLYRAIRDGEFPAVRIRGRIIVPVAAIERMVNDALETGAMVDAADYVPKRGA